jgi:putative ABC transport system permease protein
MHPLRSVLKTPGFTAAVVAILALGIGANTAIFTLTDALFLRALPYADPGRLVLVNDDRISLPFFEHLRAHGPSFAAASALTDEVFNLSGHSDPEQIASARASANFFDVLGVKAAAGRTFLADEDEKYVVVLSSELATRLFGNTDRAVNQSLTLDSRVFTVVGVLPASFTFPVLGPRRDIWAPRLRDFSLVTPARIERGGIYYYSVARLAPGVSSKQADSELAVLFDQYHRDKPSNFDATMARILHTESLRDHIVTGIRPTLLILSGAVACVLLIACANVAGLLLSRAIGRKKDFAVRAALGAPRRTLILQLLAESAVIAILSGGLGIALAQAWTRLLASLSHNTEISLDWRVMLFALAISLLSAVLFGLAPALELSRTDVRTALGREGRGSTSRHRSRSVLVVVQVGISMVLLVASGLLIRSFAHLRNAPPGFDPHGILTMQVPLPTAKYGTPARVIAFYQETLRRVQSLPGVEAAAISTALPVYANHSAPALFEGQPDVALGQRPLVILQQITPDYGRVMRVQLLSGRPFDDHDDIQAPKVVMLNQTAANRFWPNENPLGKKVWLGTLPDPFVVTGVSADTKNTGLAAVPQAEVFLPLPQLAAPNLMLSLRTAADPRGLASAVRAQMNSIDPDQPLTEVQTMEDYVASLSAEPRLTMLLLGVFAGAAFVLAVVGIYSVIAYGAVNRAPEMGIRIALGAAKTDILRLMIGDGVMLALIGVVLGIGGSLALTRVMSSLLYETSPQDPLILIASAGLFIAVAILASYLPARKAASVDPAETLRSA